MEWNILAGAVVSVLCICVVVYLLVEKKENDETKRNDFTTLSNSLIAALSVAINICAGVSYALFKCGIAKYGPEGIDRDYVNFAYLYAWHFIDILPLVRVPELLAMKDPPMTIGNWCAGVPVLAFKLFVVLEIVKSVKEWFDKKKERAKKNEKKPG
jgi:hypothetical protein